MSTQSSNGRELTFGAAIREALAEELRRDPTVFIIGEDRTESIYSYPLELIETD